MPPRPFNKNPKLLIIRGLPGSGKSTLAKNIEKIHDFNHVETDMYFINVNGEYIYNKSLIQKAHLWCMNEVESLLKDNLDVVVSNTFATFREIEPYVELSKKYKYNFAIMRCDGDYGSIHNIPEEVINNMKLKFELIPGEVKSEGVV